MRIKYQPLSIDNINDIKQHYIKQGGNALALRMIRAIRSEISTLLNNPYKAPPYELVPEVRRLVVAKGAFLVFHRINEAESIVEILHVRRSEREPATQKDLK